MAQRSRDGEKMIRLKMSVRADDKKQFLDFVEQNGFTSRRSAFSELLRLAEKNCAFVKLEEKENSGSPEEEESQKVEPSKKGKGGKTAKGKGQGKGKNGADASVEEGEDVNDDKPESKIPVAKKRAPAKKSAAKKVDDVQDPLVKATLTVDDEVRPAANKGKRGKKAATEPIAEGLELDESDEDVVGNEPLIDVSKHRMPVEYRHVNFPRDSLQIYRERAMKTLAFESDANFNFKESGFASHLSDFGAISEEEDTSDADEMNGGDPEETCVPAKKAAAEKEEQDQVNSIDNATFTVGVYKIRPAAGTIAVELIAEDLEYDEDAGENGNPESPVFGDDEDEDRAVAKKQLKDPFPVQDSDTGDESQEPLANIVERLEKKKSAFPMAVALQSEPAQLTESAAGGDGKKSGKRNLVKAAKGKKEEESAHLDEPVPSNAAVRPKRSRAAKGKPVKHADY